jgi:Holliday junction resolvase RusA-like endonuclease
VSAHVYVIEGVPRSGKNSQRQAVNRRTGRRFVLKSKAASAWLDAAEAQLLVQRGKRKPLGGPLAIHVACYQRADVCDGDNMQALVWDALKGLIVEDDKQFVEWSGAKDIDRVRPRVEVTIRQLGAA